MRFLNIVIVLLIALNVIGIVHAATLFEDNFDSGLGRWNLYGSPSPRIISSAAGQTNVFDNNGDSMCSSGAVTQTLITFPSEFVIESDVFLSSPNPAGCWQSASVGITQNPSPLNSGTCALEAYSNGLQFGIGYIGDACWQTPEQYRRHAYFSIAMLAEDGTSESPPPYLVADKYVNGWHDLRIVVEKDLYVSFYCDDTLIYRSQKKLAPSVLQNQRIHLGDRSSGSAGKAYHNNILVTSSSDNTIAATGGSSTDVILLPSQGIGFQGTEGPYEEDHTSQIQQLDGNWAPKMTRLPNNYYATGLDSNFWDALSVKFDTNEYDPSKYTAVLRFYAQKGSYWNTQWNHYIILKGEKNPTYQDFDYNANAVISDPDVHSIGNSGGSWFEETLPGSFWKSGSFWVTLRMWNIRIDSVELKLIPNKVPQTPFSTQSVPSAGQAIQTYQLGFDGMSFNADGKNTLNLDVNKAQNSGSTVTVYDDRVEVYQRTQYGVRITFRGDRFVRTGDKISGHVRIADFVTDPVEAPLTPGNVSGTIHAILPALTQTGMITTALDDQPDHILAEQFRMVLTQNGLQMDTVAYTFDVRKENVPKTGEAIVSLTLPESWVNLHGGKDAVRIIRVSDATGIGELIPAIYTITDTNGMMNFQGISINGTSIFGMITLKATKMKQEENPGREIQPFQQPAIMTNVGLFSWLLVSLQQNPLAGILAVVVIAGIAYMGRRKGKW